MGEIINLKAARKAKARTEHQARAVANRSIFGRSKAQKAKDAADKAARNRALDQARRET
jgi:hypothetical protein